MALEIANQVFNYFLASRMPAPARSDPLPLHPTRVDEVLQNIPEIVDIPDFASRDASSLTAFTCV